MFGELLGTGMGLLLGNHNRKKQIEQQQKLTDMQVKAQKEMGMFNQRMAMKTWEDTNFLAQRKQLEKAGFNVALAMTQGLGAGGTTQTSPGNVTGGTASDKQQEVGMGLQLGLQAEMQKAQIDLTKAQTENVNADTVKKQGVDTTKTGQEIKNLEVQEVILQHESKIKEIASKVQNESKEAQIETLKQAAQKAIGDAQAALAAGQKDQATINEAITQIKQKTIEQQLAISAQHAGIAKTKVDTEATKAAMKEIAAKIELMSNEQAAMWVKLDQADKERWVKEAQLELNKKGIEFDTSDAAKAKQWVDIIMPVMDAASTAGGKGRK